MLFSSAANSFFCETRLTVDAVIVGGVIIVVMETRGHEKNSLAENLRRALCAVLHGFTFFCGKIW